MTPLKLRPRANTDLAGLWRYTAKEWGAGAADIYVRQFDEAFARLARNPEIGPRCDDIRPGYRKYLVGRHLIFYRLRENEIEVIRILHMSMDLTRHL